MKKNNRFNRTISGLSLTLIAGLLIIASCKKDPVPAGGAPSTGGSGVPVPPRMVNPTDANGVTSSLIITGSTRIPGNIPATNTKPFGDSIAISGFQKSIEVTNGGEIYLPFNYVIMTASGTYSCREYYIHVDGADSTIKVNNANPNLPSSGTMVPKIKIPSFYNFGKFCFTMRVTFVRSDGSIYQPPGFDVCVNVSAAKSCDQTVSGSEGLTFTTLRLGNAAGTATVQYNTISVPDRIDVYYNKVWVAGTGSDPGPIPPQKNCSLVVPGDGFVGQSGNLTFAYNPAVSKELTVVVSGCLGNSTAWDYKVLCPQ